MSNFCVNGNGNILQEMMELNSGKHAASMLQDIFKYFSSFLLRVG